VKRGTHATQARGVIHTDFERGFIKAEVVRWDDLCKLGSEAGLPPGTPSWPWKAKTTSCAMRDVIHFKFNV